MINPNGRLFVIEGQMKLFSISPSVSDQELLKALLVKVKKGFPNEARVSINFFSDGDNYHGEALVGYNRHCCIARTLGSSLLETAHKLDRKIIEKRKKQTFESC
jgi:hypothetical protein